MEADGPGLDEMDAPPSQQDNVTELKIEPPAAGASLQLRVQSIYDLRTPRRRLQILLAAAVISSLTPFTDTIYLPALVSVRQTLSGATDDGVAASVSAYMAAVGVASLFWGPLSDYYGRRWPVFASLVLFLAFTSGCLVAPTMDALIGLRAAEGVAVAAAVTVTQSVVAR